MIVEIGTSDFSTRAGQEQGLFIEPVKEYFDRLPVCNKENVAVSNYEGIITMYHIPSSVIKRYKLPDWLRGCNSVGKPHATAVNMGLEKHIESNEVPVVRIKTLLDKHNITSIDILKIDTEGHDCVILNDYLDTVDFLPNIIQFENNVLSNDGDVLELVSRLTEKGYKCEQVKFDMVCKL